MKILTSKKYNDLIQRISSLERQMIAIKYPDGIKIGSKVTAYGFGKPMSCFIASHIFMKFSQPYITIFSSLLDPPIREIPVESLITPKSL